MGTKNLCIVLQDQQVRVAQYGQREGYPEVMGIIIFRFLKDSSKVEQLREVVKTIRFRNETDDPQTSLSANGGEILELLVQSQTQKEIVLDNSYDFASNSLWCEWAYLIDLDQNIFEVYKGMNRDELTIQDRFYPLSEEEYIHKPVKIIRSFPLNELPSENEFVSSCLVDY